MVLIESVIISYLNGAAGISYPVYGDTPPGALPSHYYLVDKTGNSAANHLHTAQIVIQSVATDAKETAAEMNETLLGIMTDIVTLPTVSSCRLNSDYDYTDTSNNKYRYQAVFDITYYRED